MHDLRAYKDSHFPRYLQIIPFVAEAVMMPMKNNAGEVIGHKPGRLTSSGFIDIVAIACNKMQAGDQLLLPWSILQVESIEQTRPARGEYMDKSATWMRLKFKMIKSLAHA